MQKKWQDFSNRQTDTLLFHAEHLFLIIPHQRHRLLELLMALASSWILENLPLSIKACQRNALARLVMIGSLKLLFNSSPLPDPKHSVQ